MITSLLSFVSQRPWVIAIAGLALLLLLQTGRLSSEQRSHAEDNATHAQQIAAIEHKALEDTEAARTEGERRYAAQAQIADSTTTKLLAVQTHAAASDAAGIKLQERIRLLTYDLRAASGNSATAAIRETADATTSLLADVQRRLGEAENDTIRFADGSHIAGAACEAQYDSLTLRISN